MKVTFKIEPKDNPSFKHGEWLVTNALGGFACGSIAGAPFRKYHSLLNAALSSPYGRTNMLNFVADSIVLPNHKEVALSTIRREGEENPLSPYLVDFRLENGLPIWRYDIDGVIIEKDLFLINRQNTLHMSYRLLSPHEDIIIKWHPFFHFRTSEQDVNAKIPDEIYTVRSEDFRFQIECPHFPPLRIYNSLHAPLILDSQRIDKVFYKYEADRGYESTGSLKSPGFFLSPLDQNDRLTFIVSTEPWETILALSSHEASLSEKIRKRSLLKAAGDPAATSPLVAKLVLAADQFIIAPTSRFEDTIRLQALGEEIRSVIAGFPWFTDWGRDTMISLEGLTLSTGRSREAYAILHTFAHYIEDGLIPNMFPEGELTGVYNTADATLWFFHAINRYIEMTEDEEILEFLLPKLKEIIQHHIKGTRFGIKMDEKDGLLIQGQQGVQLTWMDAKVGDWVVTPRRGKAVEINALWYNALKLFEKWTNKPLEITELCYRSFNEKFWYTEGGYLYDVIEGETEKDSSLRPNQLFAISLDNPVLKEEKWKRVLDAVTADLLTPVGLRTLSPAHRDYKATYDGDLRSRDAAYHQGTVWPWLLGTYVDAWLKAYKDGYEHAYAVLKGLEAHLNTNCIGTISEIFDACPPYKARGCFAQAWSVAELLRCLVKLSPHIDLSK